MAGIKFHGAIDVEVRGNHIYRTCLGVWFDWMAQGLHVTGNLFHDNGRDLFVEVDHGPFLIDNNIFLSPATFLDNSHGGAYVHNLIAGGTQLIVHDNRLTPFHKPHSTELAALHDNSSGDDRFYNNLFLKQGDLRPYDKAQQPVFMQGNVFLGTAKPCTHEKSPLVRPDFDPAVKLVQEHDGWYLELALDKDWGTAKTRKLVTTKLLGKAAVPKLPYEQPDGSPFRLDRDYFGKGRAEANPFPGPFELPDGGTQRLKVWPIAKR